MMKKSPYVITGGGSGVGQALAWLLAEQGENVVVIGRRKEMLAMTCAKFSHHITAISADVSSEEGREKIFKHFQPVDSITALIHCAAVAQPILPLLEVSVSEWNVIQATNVVAPVFLTKKLFPKLKDARVLLINSMLSHLSHPCMTAYCVSKASIVMLYHCFQGEFHALNVHTGCVSPGIIDTPLFKQAMESRSSFPKPIQRMYEKLVNEKFLCSPTMVAHFFRWLLCSVDAETFSSKEWDIFDTTHHEHWAKDFTIPPVLPGF